LIADSGGAVVDSSFEPSFPLLAPGQSAWYVATQFNTKPASQVIFRRTYSTQPSPLQVNELPSTSGARLITSPYYSTAFVVIFDSSGTPVFAERGQIGKSILPGGSGEVTVGDFTYNGNYSSIQVLIGVVLN
jgi:hypothetical protein